MLDLFKYKCQKWPDYSNSAILLTEKKKKKKKEKKKYCTYQLF